MSDARFSNAIFQFARSGRLIPLLGVAVLVAACAAPAPLPIPQNDPYEEANRRSHGFNSAFDRSVIRPVALAYAPVAKGPVGIGIQNFAGNLSMPSVVLNKLLQGKIEDAVHNTVRFGLNSTIGLAGLFDPASAMGLPERDADFGQTLHVWGAGEGAYVMLPVIGPSTERDALGVVVDAIIDPMGQVLKPRYANAARLAKFGSKLGDRARFSDSVDSILYDSADSYAQLRLLYLQNRRFELGQEATDEDA
ncbi:MAG: VacJ family lipoprotein, partial [Gemmobacter sp.]|nr:VacJ family lipoprotein [Gemmobacter sp.]